MNADESVFQHFDEQVARLVILQTENGHRDERSLAEDIELNGLQDALGLSGNLHDSTSDLHDVQSNFEQQSPNPLLNDDALHIALKDYVTDHRGSNVDSAAHEARRSNIHLLNQASDESPSLPQEFSPSQGFGDHSLHPEFQHFTNGVSLHEILQSEIGVRSLSRSNLLFIQNEINLLLKFPLDSSEGTANVSLQTRLLALLNHFLVENAKLKSDMATMLHGGAMPSTGIDLSVEGEVEREGEGGLRYLLNIANQQRRTAPFSVSSLRTRPSISALQSVIELDTKSCNTTSDNIPGRGRKVAKNFKCRSCGKAFENLSKLKRHEATHNPNRGRFFCSVEGCNKSYATDYDLTHHHKEKHNQVVHAYQCYFPNCKETFGDSKSFIEHRIKHKNDQNCRFQDLVFSLSGTLNKTRVEYSKIIQDNGAGFCSSVTKKVTHLISCRNDVACETTLVREARKRGVFIVSEDFLLACLREGRKVEEEDYLLEPFGQFSTNKRKMCQRAEKRRRSKEIRMKRNN